MVKKRRKSHIPLRLNILFSVVVVLFGLLIYRLGVLQFQDKRKYENVLTRTRDVKTKVDVTRGQIYDRNGVLLVGNESYKTIDYTRKHSKVAELLEQAQKLAQYIDVPIDTLTTTHLKEYWMIVNDKTLQERLGQTKLSGEALFEAKLNVVTDTDINYSDQEKKIIAIFTKMNAVSYLGTVSIKNRDVTDVEIANVTEHLGNLSGISIGSDWERVYPEKDLLRSILGSVSSKQAGLPIEQQNRLLAKGYQQNSRVGTSFLEQQYDDVLRGTPKVISTVLNADNEIVSSQVEYEGKAGDNLYLSIDTNLQKKVDKILYNYLADIPNDHSLMNDAVYVTVQHVKTGDILAVSGKKFEYDATNDRYNRNTIEDATINVFTANYAMGSVVKPATVTAGYQYGVIDEANNTIIDEPISFDGGRTTISSVVNRTGRMSLNDEQALAVSSNVYMVKLAMMIGGQNYVDGIRLNIPINTQDKIRKTFASYGLGAYTGIDLPFENKGYAPEEYMLSDILMNSFGQFDTFTPLQVSQYMNTIANGGFRYAPRLVNAIRTAQTTDNSSGQLKIDIAPKLLNQVDITSGQMKRIHNGLYYVTHASYLPFPSYKVRISGKTGTAETFYNGDLQWAKGKPVNTTVFAAYAPSDNPEISVSVIIPNLNDEQSLRINAYKVAFEVFKAYYGE